MLHLCTIDICIIENRTIILRSNCLLIYASCPQLYLMATCCTHESPYEVEHSAWINVGSLTPTGTNISFTDHVNETNASRSVNGQGHTYDVCESFWIDIPQNKWEKAVLQCNIINDINPSVNLIQCNFHAAKVCKKTYTTRCRGGSKVLVCICLLLLSA